MRITRKTLIRELKEIFIIALVGALFNFLTSSFTVLNVAVSVTIWVSLSKGNGYIVDYLNTKISWVEKPITRITVGNGVHDGLHHFHFWGSDCVIQVVE